MKINDECFSTEINEKAIIAMENVVKKYDLNPGENIKLICEKIYNCNNEEDCLYVEAGVYRGNTLFTAAEFSTLFKNNFKLIGMDTFEGFPQKKIHPNDHPSKFIELFNGDYISFNHFELAKKRTENFQNIDHLSKEYFLDVEGVYNISNNYLNTELLKGDFNFTAKKINQEIDILHLDCDLYESYISCLNKLFPKVKKGGVIIFDEYYSLKYPGARIAINEFFNNIDGYFERYKTDEGFERWCFIK
tara:strand:+ start:1238 stop:1978 length:741 start_codon:yes stop_codon:yes gene_type:complete